MVKINLRNPVTATMDYWNPTTAINPKYSKSECKEYLVYARCADQVNDARDCDFPSPEQVRKCLPIDPKVPTQIVKFKEKDLKDENASLKDLYKNIQRAPEVTGTTFIQFYRQGNYPNPN